LWSSTDSDLPLTSSIVSSFVNEDIYINLHTQDYINGEIRGQVVYDSDEAVTEVNDRKTLPVGFSLEQNYPNPFNPATVISYQLSSVTHVTLKVYDVLGRQVAIPVDQNQEAGAYIVRFNGTNLPSGVYFYRLSAGNQLITKKMLLLK